MVTIICTVLTFIAFTLSVPGVVFSELNYLAVAVGFTLWAVALIDAWRDYNAPLNFVFDNGSSSTTVSPKVKSKKP